MFAWKLKRLMREEEQELISHSPSYSGANRRAINLIPLPVSSDGHELANTATVKFHHLLVTIEGNQRTCCLKIISPKKRSRAALLIFRGRVVGCLYGKRAADFHFFNQDAHQLALTDLATAGNILDAYQLPEDLVLAAASLFHGQVLDFNGSYAPRQILEAAVQQIMAFGLPGCVVVNTGDNEMVCMVYIAGGRILGVYSSQDGWVEPTAQAALGYLSALPDAKVVASVLAVRTVDDVARMGFSLTGLGDRRFGVVKSAYTRSQEADTVQLPPGEYHGHRPQAPIHPAHYSGTHRNYTASRHGRHAHAIRPL
jgi:hypothetical protein